jgi:hypothetical protein
VGESQEPKDSRLQSYAAAAIGLNLAQYDADSKPEEVRAWVVRGVADGESLEVRGTPTF